MRAGHRSSTTRLMHQLEGEYEIEDGPTIERLMQCKLSLNEKLQRLGTLDEEILTLVGDDDIESEIEQADIFKERIHQAILHVQHKISVKQSATPLSTDSSHSVSTTTTAAPETSTVTSADTPVTTTAVIPPTSGPLPDTSHSPAVSGATTVTTSGTMTPVVHHEVAETSTSRVKLPKIEPKKFNGDLTKWETFWSFFESSIHLNPALTAVDKFHYLSSLLEDPASAAIAGLKLTAPNYV